MRVLSLRVSSPKQSAMEDGEIQKLFIMPINLMLANQKNTEDKN